jgi:hypothetical protein
MESLDSVIFKTDSLVLALSLLALMIAFMYLGGWLHRRQAKGTIDLKESRTPIVSAMMGLLAFLLAFSFGMSGSRFDARRQVIVNEANAMGTAILRADLYPDSLRAGFRADFKEYLEARITYFEAGSDVEKLLSALARSGSITERLWERATRNSRNPQLNVASLQMVPALNEMFDLATTRWIGEVSRVPDIVVWMLFTVSIVSAFFHGYTYADRMDWFAGISFCLLTAVVIYITLDLDRPRRGVIGLAVPHEAVLELRNMF